MKIIIKKEHIQRDLSILNSIADTKSGLSALSSVLLEAKDNLLKVSATDLDNTLIITIPCDIKTEGSVCIPVVKFKSILLNANGDITLSKDSKDWVELKHGTSKNKIAGTPANMFPKVDVTLDNIFTIEGDTLIDLIKRVAFNTTQEESRFALSGANIKVKDGKIQLASSDGHRLSVTEASIKNTQVNTTFLLPKKALVEVPKILKELVTIANNGNHIVFSSGNKTLVCRKLTGLFPEFESFVPKDNKITMQVHPKEMADAIKRVAATVDTTNYCLDLTISEDLCTLSTTSADGESEDRVPCKTANLGKDLKIYINYTYLLDYLNIAVKPVFCLKDDKTQLVIKDGNSYYMVALMRK